MGTSPQYDHDKPRPWYKASTMKNNSQFDSYIGPHSGPKLSPRSILQAITIRNDQRGNLHNSGSILLTTLVVILVAMIGGAVLLSKSINSLNASSDAADLQTAKEAAETGFNEILAALNTDARSYLLVTKLANWGSGGVSIPTWTAAIFTTHLQP